MKITSTWATTCVPEGRPFASLDWSVQDDSLANSNSCLSIDKKPGYAFIAVFSPLVVVDP